MRGDNPNYKQLLSPMSLQVSSKSLYDHINSKPALYHPKRKLKALENHTAEYLRNPTSLQVAYMWLSSYAVGEPGRPTINSRSRGGASATPGFGSLALSVEVLCSFSGLGLLLIVFCFVWPQHLVDTRRAWWTKGVSPSVGDP